MTKADFDANIVYLKNKMDAAKQETREQIKNLEVGIRRGIGAASGKRIGSKISNHRLQKIYHEQN